MSRVSRFNSYDFRRRATERTLFALGGLAVVGGLFFAGRPAFERLSDTAAIADFGHAAAEPAQQHEAEDYLHSAELFAAASGLITAGALLQRKRREIDFSNDIEDYAHDEALFQGEDSF